MIKLAHFLGFFCFCQFIQPILAQSSLALSSTGATSTAVGSLSLTLASAGNQPAGLQWTFTYPSSMTGISVVAAPALLAAGKSVNCKGNASAYTCVASGMNSNVIGNGVLATISFVPSGTASVPVAFTNAVAVSPVGASVPISGSGIVLTTFGVSSLQCAAAPNGDTCTVTLSGAAPASGALIQLSSTNPDLSVPTSLAIPSAATTVSFTATVSPVATAQTAQITASLGTSTATATVSLPPPLFQIQGGIAEVSGITNGSKVTPEIAPGGFIGSVVVNGNGTVNFAPGETGTGVYFLNCCSNTNEAYYKFTGAAVGNIFNTNQGQISFYLKSRYSFAQRVASAPNPRYSFDVRDGNNNHLFGFLTQISAGSLVFNYLAAGAGSWYYVPSGTEDALFGNGIVLQVTISWSSTGVKLYLNNTLVKSSSYTAPSPDWTAASNFDLGAWEYFTFGGYNTSDDIINQFTVMAVPHQ
jgi:hypothetical protein